MTYALNTILYHPLFTTFLSTSFLLYLFILSPSKFSHDNKTSETWVTRNLFNKTPEYSISLSLSFFTHNQRRSGRNLSKKWGSKIFCTYLPTYLGTYPPTYISFPLYLLSSSSSFFLSFYSVTPKACPNKLVHNFK